jgi:tetratricopeptide (TPR) repeat protein
MIDPTLAKLLSEALGRRAQGDRNGAMVAYKRAQRRFPGFAGAWTGAAELLCELGRFEEAAWAAERALELDGGEHAAIFALLDALMNLGRSGGQEFREAYGRAMRLDVSSPALLAERGYARLCALDMAGAEADCRAAMERGLDSDYVRSMLAHALHAQGRSREAWPLYGPGMALGAMFEKYDSGARRWDGGPTRGGALMVRTYHHGFGDAIQFARYMPQVGALSGGRVVLSVYGPLLRLLEGLPGADAVVEQEREDAPYGAAINLLELPIVLGIDTSAPPPPIDVPQTGGEPPSELLRPGFKVGLAWAGSPIHSCDAQRSMDPRLLDALADVEGVAWYGLQKPPAQEPPRLPGFADLSPHMGDFLDTARLVRCLDLVATVDTALLHLAGSVGAPTVALLAHMPEWRWGPGGATPWYPSVRLVRQPSGGDWPGAVEGLREHILRRRATNPDWRRS